MTTQPTPPDAEVTDIHHELAHQISLQAEKAFKGATWYGWDERAAAQIIANHAKREVEKATSSNKMWTALRAELADLRTQLQAAQSELAAHKPGSTDAGYIFNQMRKAFVALGGSEHEFKAPKLVELAQAAREDVARQRNAAREAVRVIKQIADLANISAPARAMLVEVGGFLNGIRKDTPPDLVLGTTDENWKAVDAKIAAMSKGPR